MNNFKERELNEKKFIGKIVGNWLKDYTQEVILRVLEKRDEIINNEFTMNLLRELYEREQKENEEFNNDITSLLENFEEFKEYDTHKHLLTHSKSYRDILYDMYIDIK